MDSVLLQLRAAGLIVDQLEYGRIIRCKAEGDKGGKRSGWYVLYQIRLDNGEMLTVGRFGNWKRFGGESLKVEIDKRSLNDDERRRLEQEQQRLREEAALERQRKVVEAASRANRMWPKLPDSGKSEYLQRKKVGAHGVRFGRGMLVIPVRNETGLVGLQFIQPDGEKKFLTGTPKEGSWHVIGELPSDKTAHFRMWIGEGYATCASVFQAKGEPTLVAFDAGNLPHVARAMRTMYVNAEIVIAADNDRFTVNKTTNEPENPGVEFAHKAAAAVGARVVAPAFPDDDTKSTDFNDLHVTAGLRTVRQQLVDGLDAAPVPLDESPAPPVNDEAPEDDDEPPVWAMTAITVESALERFALVMPDGKVWDSHTKQLLRKAVARDLMKKKIFDEWIKHEARRTTDKNVVAPAAKTAAAAGGAGLVRALKRYVYLYPSSEVWDCDRRQRVPVSALKIAIADCYDYWLTSPNRRELDVERLVFDPSQRCDPKTHINTFRGLPLAPLKDRTKCEAICELVLHLCGDRPDVYAWLMSWLAYPLQFVGTKMATAVLMHSHIQGSGKSLFFEEVIKPMYGEYGSTLGQHQLESQYTDWRSQLLFGLFEEIFSRDQKYSHTGTLKHMITGKTQRIEKKFVSGWEESNFMNAVFLSNEIQPFPVDPTDRRMLVVWPRKKMAPELKSRVLAEIRDGGIEAFYALLLDFPLNGHGTHTEPPVTEEKERLIDFGRPAWEVFFIEWKNGLLDVPFMPCLSIQLFGAYRRWCERRREHVVSETKFQQFLAVQEGLRRRRDVHYDKGQDGKKGTFFIPASPADPFGKGEDEQQSAWLARCVKTFDEIVSPAGPPDMS